MLKYRQCRRDKQVIYNLYFGTWSHFNGSLNDDIHPINCGHCNKRILHTISWEWGFTKVDSCEGNLRELVCSPKAFTVLLIALDYKRLQEMPNQNPNGNRSLEIKRERDCALTSINNKCTAAKSDIGSPPIPPFSKSANSKQQIVNRDFQWVFNDKKTFIFLSHSQTK